MADGAAASLDRPRDTEQSAEASPRPGSLQLAAGLALFTGAAATIMGGAHLEGVVRVASTKDYAYDLRFGALLIIGLGITFAGVISLSAVRGLADGQRRAWDRALIGALLLLFVTAPIIPHPNQGQMASGLSFFAAVSLVALVVAWPRLGTGPFSPAVAPEPGTASGTKLINACGRCGQILNPTWDKCLHCGASFADHPPVPRSV